VVFVTTLSGHVAVLSVYVVAVCTPFLSVLLCKLSVFVVAVCTPFLSVLLCKLSAYVVAMCTSFLPVLLFTQQNRQEGRTHGNNINRKYSHMPR
jgi:hypothetical protein